MHGSETFTLKHETSAGDLSVSDGYATFSLKRLEMSFAEAQRLSNEFLTSWEGELMLQSGPRRRTFELSAWDVGTDNGGALLRSSFAIIGPQAGTNTRRNRPWRCHRYEPDDLVSSLISRFAKSRRGTEKTTVMAYFFLTALKEAFAGTQGLSCSLQVAGNVIKEIGRLTSVRKFVQNSAESLQAALAGRLVSHDQLFRLEKTIYELIHRAGEIRAGPNPGQLLALPAESERGTG